MNVPTYEALPRRSSVVSGASKSEELLRSGLADPDIVVVLESARGLARLGVATGPARLKELLSHEEPLQRVQSAWYLASLGDRTGLEAVEASGPGRSGGSIRAPQDGVAWAVQVLSWIETKDGAEEVLLEAASIKNWPLQAAWWRRGVWPRLGHDRWPCRYSRGCIRILLTNKSLPDMRLADRARCGPSGTEPGIEGLRRDSPPRMRPRKSFEPLSSYELRWRMLRFYPICVGCWGVPTSASACGPPRRFSTLGRVGGRWRDPFRGPVTGVLRSRGRRPKAKKTLILG